MANIHVLTGNNGTYRLVLHVDTPIGNNQNGVSWSAAVLASGLAGSSVLQIGPGVGQITSGEYAQIMAGTRVEVVREVSIPPGQSQAQLQALAANYYANNSASIVAELQDRLLYFGPVS